VACSLCVGSGIRLRARSSRARSSGSGWHIFFLKMEHGVNWNTCCQK
jgi:hypothetical protein